MHPFKVLAVLIVVSSLVVMCASPGNYPADSTVLKQARAELKKQYDDVGDLLELDQLEIAEVIPSENAYKAKVHYSYSFNRSLQEEIRQWEANTPSATSFAGGAKSLALLELRNRFGDFKAGESFDGNLHLNYTKKDDAWVYSP